MLELGRSIYASMRSSSAFYFLPFLLRAKKKKKVIKTFHVPKESVLVQVNNKEFIEYIGNESQQGGSEYFAGGIFVRPKTTKA